MRNSIFKTSNKKNRVMEFSYKILIWSDNIGKILSIIDTFKKNNNIVKVIN